MNNPQPCDPEIAEELSEVKDLFNDYLDRFGDIYFWEPARKARAIALAGLISNILTFINAAFFHYLQPQKLSISIEVTEWAYKSSAFFCAIFLVLTVITNISLALKKQQSLVLSITLALVSITLASFSSFVGVFDGLTWFLFFMYTSIGFVLLTWQQVTTTVFFIVSFMVLITVFHAELPYPVQAYMFSRNEDIASMSFINLLSAWGIFSTCAFIAVWMIGILMRNWHHKALDQNTRSELDELTQVMKRSAVLDALEESVITAAREEKILTLAVVDLDAFKNLNENYGHVFGDTALSHFARLLTEVTRQEDLVGRYGGQEFIVVFPNCTVSVAAAVLERLRIKMSGTPLDHEGKKVALTFSAGLSRLRPGDNKYENIIARADIALGKAKNEGKNRIIKDES